MPTITCKKQELFSEVHLYQTYTFCFFPNSYLTKKLISYLLKSFCCSRSTERNHFISYDIQKKRFLILYTIAEALDIITQNSVHCKRDDICSIHKSRQYTLQKTWHIQSHIGLTTHS